MIILPTKYIRLAGDLAEPDDPLVLPVEVGGYRDRRAGEYQRWAKYQVRYNFRTGQYEAEGAIETPWGGETDALYLAAASLPALYGALTDMQVEF